MIARSAPKSLHILALRALLAMVLLAVGCGETIITTTLPTSKDGSGDLGAMDLPKAPTDTGAEWACPGGHGCACTDDAGCTFSGLCSADAKGEMRCALPCPEGYCGPTERCATVPEAKDAGHWCVARTAYACDPCATSAECKARGHAGAACVSYGAEGFFCGIACQGNADCETGYHCAMVPSAEGDKSTQCVKNGAKPEDMGVCTCSPRAIAKKLETTCAKGKCQGKRACGEGGLGLCLAKEPAPETCNGQDDDCDGDVDNSACDDKNPCTVDICQGVAGCAHTPLDGEACNADNSVCTVDACKAGACKAGEANKCDDGNPCTTDNCSATKGCQNVVSSGKPCDDGDGCSEGDVCTGATCSAGKPKLCDDKNPCTADKCAAGACVADAVDGAPCSDGDKCTGADVCAGGQCGGKPVACNDGNPCTDDSCDPAGGCQALPVAATACDDGDLCTQGEKCLSGKCQGGTAKTCTSDSPCMTAACQPATGACATKVKVDGTPCSDGKACSSGDACALGSCVGKLACDDQDACTADICGVSGACAHVPITVGTCAPAACQGVDCNDKNPCTVDGCAAAGCTHSPASGTNCDDANACTVGDVCSLQGSCGGAQVVCGDDNPCTDDTCDPKAGCTYLLNTAPCDVGGCKAGVCAAGTCKDTGVVGCDDKNPCTTDACGANGCTHQAAADGATCDDGKLCTDNDACAGGACGGTAKTCADGGPCATNSCDAATGNCSLKPETNNTPCNDGDPCTAAEACQAGACKGAAVDCDDKNPCTVDVCAKPDGCAHAATTNGTVCDDGSKCTTGDICTGGKCLGGSALSCDDKNPCTSDGCDLAKGCTTADLADGTGCDDGSACTSKDACTKGKCAGILADDAVTSFSGVGETGFANGPATVAKFTLPAAIAVGAGGALYVADAAAGGARIRKVAADGSVTTVAGIGLDGFADGPALTAKFWNPAGLVVDASGNVYVADRFNQRIRKIATNGTVSTLAGDAADPGFGDPKAVGGYKDAVGKAALFDEPSAIALGPDGNLYVTEAANHKVRMVAMDGTVTTVAGSTQGYSDASAATAKFNAPQGIAVAADGTIYVADTGNNRIRAIAGGKVTTYAGTGLFGFVDGPLLDACMAAPAGLTLGVDGKLYVADSGNNAIRALDTVDVKTLAGMGSAAFADGLPLSAKFNGDLGVVQTAKGTWYVADTKNFRIRKIDSPALNCQP